MKSYQMFFCLFFFFSQRNNSVVFNEKPREQTYPHKASNLNSNPGYLLIVIFPYFLTSLGRAFVERLHQRRSTAISVGGFACGFAGSRCIGANCCDHCRPEEARSNTKSYHPASKGSRVTF